MSFDKLVSAFLFVTLIEHDAREPGGKRGALLEARNMLVSVDLRSLHRILRLNITSQYRHAYAIKALVIAADNDLE